MRPDLSAIHAAARRERAVEMHRLLIAPLVAWFRRAKAAAAGRAATVPAGCA